VYYRCHTKGCPTNTIREEAVDREFSQLFEPLVFDDEERAILSKTLGEVSEDITALWEKETNAMRMQFAQLQERLDRLTDAYIDRLIDRNTFEQRKGSILMERETLRERTSQPMHVIMTRLSKFLELAGGAYLLYRTTLSDEKRCLVQIATSNRAVNENRLAMTLKSPFHEVANRYLIAYGSPSQDRHRTLEALVRKLITWFTENPTDEFDLSSIRPNDLTRGGKHLKMGDAAA